MATEAKLILDHIQEHEQAHRDHVYLTQPVGGGQVTDYTWGQVVDQARRMARHLQDMGLRDGAHVAILSKNCAHFFMAELAIWMAGCTTVAIFPTETEATIRFVLEHSESRTLFVGKLDAWAQQSSAVPEGLPCIALPLAPATSYEGWDAITARTEPLAGTIQRKPDDLAMLLYTSGSTGQPKGVMMDFRGVSAVAEGFVAELRTRMGSAAGIRVLSYLPLAHCFERACIECTSWVDGRVQVFFAEALDTFVQDLRRARPTLFVSVPRLWLKFQQGVLTKMPAEKLNKLLAIPIVRGIVGRKVLAGLGLDQCKLAASGSAPIPPELIAWYRRLGLNLLEGYGMSEDFAYSHRSTEEHHAPGYVGVPYDGVEVRIGAHNEVQIKSPGRMVGYYKQPDLNAECFTTDGFFRTGDMGERRADGLLKLTGRVKELFKTAKGEYVAPAPIENRINEHPMVELSMVSGVGEAAAYALVVLNEDLRPRVATDAALRASVEGAMAHLRTRVNQGLPQHERIRMIVIAKHPWSIENNCLTPTMKIRRARIEGIAAPKLSQWYAANAPVLWA